MDFSKTHRFDSMWSPTGARPTLLVERPLIDLCAPVQVCLFDPASM